MDTVRRVVEKLNPAGLAALLRPAGESGSRPRRLAADGKSAGGSHTRRRQAAHLLAIIDQDDRLLAQLRVPDKTNEIPCLRDLLEILDITGAVVTADALHTQVETARFLVEEKKAHYVLTVKANQPTLYASCRALPWAKATAKHYAAAGATAAPRPASPRSSPSPTSPSRMSVRSPGSPATALRRPPGNEPARRST
ncbi:ISAs1 family transposase [Streptomyces sp. 1222.5]|uniref:ISAs1 family transposase n=1 Tax=Streptomyces sp. 1222.5 TaxID=1881026 RepID=UPI003D749EC4